MKFREYEAKQIFRDAGIPVPNSELIEAAAYVLSGNRFSSYSLYVWLGEKLSECFIFRGFGRSFSGRDCDGKTI